MKRKALILHSILVLFPSFFLTLILSITTAAYPKSLITPIQTNYLGIGFNSLKESFIYDNTCLRFNNSETETIYGVNSTSYYCFVNSKRELEEKFLNNFSYGPISNIIVKSKVTESIVNNTVFSADKITIIAYWKQEDQKIYSDDLPFMNDDALSLLKNYPKKFFELYGDKYVSSVTLGKMLWIVYQADISRYFSYSTRTKNAIKQAMELNMRRILGAKLSSQETRFVNDKLADVSVTIHTYGNGIADSMGPYSNDDFKKLIKDLSNSQSSVIACELKDYTRVYNWNEDSLYDIAEYMAMTREWAKHLSNLNYITSNSKIGFSLLSDCLKEIDEINYQLKLISSLDNDARFPSDKEKDFLESLYNRYLTELQVAPRTYSMPPIEKKLEIDLSNLSDVEKIQIYCNYPKGRRSFGKELIVSLYIVDEDGNWCELKRVPMSKPIIQLYEGIKLYDKFKIGFSDQKINKEEVKIMISFTEKVDDIIWLTVNDKDKV